MAAGYIGPADAAAGGHLPLGAGREAVQAVALGDDVPLSPVQALPHAPAHLGAGLPGVQLLQHVVIHADHVHERQGVAVAVGIQGVGQGHLGGQLPPGAEVHEDLVLNAPAGIGGQPDVLLRLEGGDALDEPDGADGDQVILVPALGVVLLDDMRHQAQVVLDEDVPGLQVAGGAALQTAPLLLRLQGTGKGSGGVGQAQGEKLPGTDPFHRGQHIPVFPAGGRRSSRNHGLPSAPFAGGGPHSFSPPPGGYA